MTNATDLFAAERERQVDEEGYDAAHDAQHAWALIYAGTAYAIEAATVIDMGGQIATATDLATIPGWWPWLPEYWKPTGDPKRDLVKAGALIAAALDSLLAQEGN